VHLNVGQVHGEAIGFVNVIQHLDAGAAPAEEAFVRLVMDPLAAYLNAHPTRRAVLLVDALDEAFTSALRHRTMLSRPMRASETVYPHDPAESTALEAVHDDRQRMFTDCGRRLGEPGRRSSMCWPA
jgi:hypothetical protein